MHRTLKVTSIVSLLIALLLGIALSAQAISFDSLLKKETPALTDPGFLPVEQAFQVSGKRDGDTIIIKFQVTPEHYLYQHMLRFEAEDSVKTQLGKPVLPKGEIKYDQFMKKNLETYPTTVEFPIPVTTQEEFPEIKVTFQGCANAGLCYAPTSVNLIPLSVTATISTTPPTPPESPAMKVVEGGEPEVKEDPKVTKGIDDTAIQSSYAEDTFLNSLLSDASLARILLLFYLGGLTLTFTPCVLPMIPIVSSMVVNSEGSRRHKVLLTASYVIAMALTYAVAGMLMGSFGASLNLQAHLQSPWLLIPFALLFVLLALAMFGLYELQLPEKLRDRLTGIDQSSGSRHKGTLTGAALAGIFSTLLVSPCVSAPLAGALVFISSTGNIAIGGLSLFALGLGMGTPLFIVGAGGANLLPKAGMWMEGIKQAFGLLMLGVAIWMLERLIPAQITMLLWGSLSIGTAICLGALNFTQKQGWAIFRQTVGILFLIYGTALFAGGLHGYTNPLQPLGSPYQGDYRKALGSEAPITGLKPFVVVKSSKELNAALARAAEAGQPAFVDIYADWCIACKSFERNTLPHPEVQQVLVPFVAIKLDITDNSPDQQAIMEKFQLFGPPAYLFYSQSGDTLKNLQKQGEVSKETLLSLLRKARQAP